MPSKQIYLIFLKKENYDTTHTHTKKKKKISSHTQSACDKVSLKYLGWIWF